MQPTIQYSIYINILKPTVQLQIYSTQPTIQNIHEYSQTYTVQLQIQYTVYTAKHTVYTWIFSSLQFSYKYTVHCMSVIFKVKKITAPSWIFSSLQYSSYKYTVQYTANHTEYTWIFSSLQYSYKYTVQYTAKHTVYTWIFSSLQYSYKYTVHSQPCRIYMNILKPTVQLLIYRTQSTLLYIQFIHEYSQAYSTVQLQIYSTQPTVLYIPYNVYALILSSLQYSTATNMH